MVGRADDGMRRWKGCARGCWRSSLRQALPRRPRVFFEEWDEPHISAIRWVSELGHRRGDDVFPELSTQSLARTGSWRTAPRSCAAIRTRRRLVVRQEFRAEKVAALPAGRRDAVRDRQLFEIKSADILQPGPAALTDGVEQLHRIFVEWSKAHA